jgi:hypothetical protein
MIFREAMALFAAAGLSRHSCMRRRVAAVKVCVQPAAAKPEALAKTGLCVSSSPSERVANQ